MNIAKKNIVEMIGIIKANYSYAYKDVDSDSMSLLIETWFESLSKYDGRIVMVAFKKALETCKMPPTLADIIQNIKQMKVATEPTDTELWNELVKAVEVTNDCIYYYNFYIVESNGKTQSENAKDRFNKLWEELPQILKDYCGNKSGLVDIAQTDLEFEKNRFLKQLPTLKQRQEIKATTNPEILKIASGVVKELGSEEHLKIENKE